MEGGHDGGSRRFPCIVSQVLHSRRNLVFSISRKLRALCTTGRVSFATNPKCAVTRVAPHASRDPTVPAARGSAGTRATSDDVPSAAHKVK